MDMPEAKRLAEIEAATPATGGVSLGARHAHTLEVGAFAALWLAASLFAIVIAKALPAKATQWDFSVYYVSALMMREGGNPYRTSLRPLGDRLGLKTEALDRNTDPPSFILCFEPLTLLRPWPAYWVWIGLNLMALAAAIALLLRREPRLSAPAALMIVALVILYPPLGEHLVWAQSKLPILLMLVLMLRWLEQGRDVAAGLILAGAGLLRVFPLLLIVYLALLRRWRVIGWTVIGLTVGGIATLALVGLERSLSFLYALPFLGERKWILLPGNIAVGSFVSRIFWDFLGARPGSTSDLVRRAAAIVAQLILLGFTLRATLVAKPREGNIGRTFALWVAAAVMLSPAAWFYDMVLLMIALVEMAAAAPAGTLSRRALLAGLASYALTWFVYVDIVMHFDFLKAHPHSLAWVLGDFPAALLTYISIYWFAIDRVARVEVPVQLSPERTALQTPRTH